VATQIVETCAEPDDLILHDVVVYRPLYEWARKEGRRQAYISRARKDHDDPVRWLREIAPAITKVFPLGTAEVPDVIRQPLGSKSIWNDAGDVTRVAISAAGGGHADAETFLEAALAGVTSFARNAGRDVSIFVVLGPNFTGRVTLPPRIPGSVSVTHYLDPWHSLYQGTDLLVCQGGYNTVQELLHYGTAAVTVAGSRPYDDQSARLAAIVTQANIRIAQPDAASISGHLAALALSPRRGAVPASPPDGARYIAERLTNWD
jgi:predicted glycosyltransferase